MGDYFNLDDVFYAMGPQAGYYRHRPAVAQRAETSQGALQLPTVRQLEQDMGRALLVIQTLLRICQEKGLFQRDEFLARLHQIDLEDGKLDGRLKRERAPLYCPHCGKTNNHAATTCMYCGGVIEPQSAL